MAKLVVISDEMKDRTFELTEEKVTVGRLPDNTISLDNGAVSSHHAEMIKKGDDYILHDLNSTNGTRVNGQRIVETRLSHGDTVWFGHLELQYLSTAKGASQPLPSRRKTIDLSNSKVNTVNGRPTTFINDRLFSKNTTSKTKKGLQIALIVSGVVALVVLGIALFLLIKG